MEDGKREMERKTVGIRGRWKRESQSIRTRRKKSAMRLLLAAGGGGLNKVQLSCPNTGIVAVPETDRWTGTLSNDEAKRWRVAEAAQWLRLSSRWPLAFLFACGPSDASASNTKASLFLSPIAVCTVLYCTVAWYGQSRNSTPHLSV
ncbi:hypothetical protein J3F84DRAFT_297665 [Trichoderma pleuroticola]